MKRIGVVCGGSGSSKFARAMANYSERRKEKADLGFVANVGDNYWFHGLYVCPDVDILVYSLSGLLDRSKGWGIKSDGFRMKKMLSKLTGEEWFGLGDSDAAFSIRRTELMNKGWKLSSVTDYYCKALGIKYRVMPATDNSVITYIQTKEGRMHLQEYWVKHKGRPEVTDVEYSGIGTATPNENAIKYLSDYVFICPANPVTSILPTIRIKKIQSALKKSKVLAISPFIGEKPFSGPAGKLMKALGLEADSFGVASLYSQFLKIMLVDKSEDQTIVKKIKELGIECVKTNTKIESSSDESRIAKEVLESF